MRESQHKAVPSEARASNRPSRGRCAKQGKRGSCLPKSARLTRQTSDCQSKLRTELLARSPHWEDGFPGGRTGEGNVLGQPLSDCSAKCCLINYPGKKKRKKWTFFSHFKEQEEAEAQRGWPTQGHSESKWLSWA